VVDICRFFGVDPVKVFETKDSKYNTVESMQLATLTDTLSPAMAKQEAEYNRKLFVPSLRTTRRIRFDEESLLRADMDSRANYRMKGFQIGTFTIDDNREAAGKTPFNTPMSSTAWVQVNMQPINKLENGTEGSKTPGSGTEPGQNE
jgi:phage portal protein BeeE